METKLKILSNPRTCGDVGRKRVEVWWPYGRIYSVQYEFRLFLGISVTFVDSLFLMGSNNYRH